MQEQKLIEETLKGNTDAFDLLVKEHRAGVYRHCLGLVKDEGAAEDLTQETFVHAFQHLADFRMEAQFGTWLWRIAHNLSLNYLKKHRLVEQEFKEEMLYPQSEKEEKHPSLASLEEIAEAMSHLSDKLRAVFELYDLQHIPQKEIASRLGIPYGTVRSRLHAARKRLRTHLKKQ